MTGTSSLSGNVGIGGDSGTETLLVAGSERVTSNLHVGGNLVVDGSFNFSEVIQNITTVNNEVILSTQLDISNQGTGPALKVSQFGVGDDQDVALFNAGDEGDAFKIDSSGNSHFYKEVNIVKENDVSFDTILIRRTDATAKIMNLRTLQVYANNINILPSATNATTLVGSGTIGEVIEFITWNDLVAVYRADGLYSASNIRNNNISNDYNSHSLNSDTPYISLYIPLTQSFNISDIQSFVLYNRSASSVDRINGFEIELYNRSNGFTPGTNVLYSMPINTTAYVYRFDLPAIDTYTFGFTTTDSETQIKDITVSASTQNFDTTLLKVEGGNTELGGDLSVSGTTRLNTSEVGNNVGKFDTILIRRTDATSGRIDLKTLQVYESNINILPSATNATTSVGSGTIGEVIEFITWNNLVVSSHVHNQYRAMNIRTISNRNYSHDVPYISLYIPLTQSFNISDIQSFVLYNNSGDRINGFQIELYNRSNGFTPGANVLYSMPINTTAGVYRFDLPAITSYTGGFSTDDSETQIKDITVSASTQIDTTLLKVEGGMNDYKFRSGIYSNKIYNNINFDHILSCSQNASNSEPNGLLLQGNGETGLLIHNVSTTTGWFIGLNGRDTTNLDFFYSHVDNLALVNSNTSKGYLNASTDVNQIDFTGQHRCFIKDLPFSNTDVYEGRIVCADQNTNITISGSIKKGNQAITQNETLPYVSLSVKNNDKSCFGVISASEDPNERVDRYGSFCTPFEKEKGDTRVYINSVGEGAIWVSNKNGELESGDYITTCDLLGYGVKQDSEFLANYTVAKITMDCDFNPRYVPRPTIMKDASGENILDPYEQIQWTDEEDASGNIVYEYEYNILYVNNEAQIIPYEEYIDNSNNAYIVAYVGCTYHCG